MSFELVAVLVAGLAGSLVMSATMQMATRAGLTQMAPMELVTGSMMSSDRAVASRLGIMIHYGVMETAVFGIAYAGLFSALGNGSVGTGALIGVAHGILFGLVGMPMMPALHARMSSTAVAPGGNVLSFDGGQRTLTAPGVLGSKEGGGMTPIGIVVGHIVYGIVVAGVYSWLS